MDVAAQGFYRVDRHLARLCNTHIARIANVQSYGDLAIFFAGVFGIPGHDMRKQNRIRHTVR
ncbi:hypothetical protein SODG_005540 [Sodalis praecaptivus]